MTNEIINNLTLEESLNLLNNTNNKEIIQKLLILKEINKTLTKVYEEILYLEKRGINEISTNEIKLIIEKISKKIK